MPNDTQDRKLLILMNGYYHADRHAFLSNLDYVVKLAIAILSTSIVGRTCELLHVDPLFAEAALATVASIHLIAFVGERARTHEILRRGYFELLNERDDDKIAKELVRLAAEEEPSRRAALALAFNRALNSAEFPGGAGPSGRLQVTPWQSFTRHIFAYGNTEFSQFRTSSPNGA